MAEKFDNLMTGDELSKKFGEMLDGDPSTEKEIAPDAKMRELLDSIKESMISFEKALDNHSLTDDEIRKYTQQLSEFRGEFPEIFSF